MKTSRLSGGRWGLALSPRLECSGHNHGSLQLNLPGSSNLLPQRSQGTGTTGGAMPPCQANFFYFLQR
uniref:Uncharacterized protein n=1 Tax=Astyanax mexicanus TaxID=7994 RepID=A0A3B1J6S9_ASTMX